MRIAALLTGACLLAFTTVTAQAEVTDEQFQDMQDHVNAFVDDLMALDNFSPGLTVTVVTADGDAFIRTEGVLNVATGAPVEPDSAMYIASMTKAYMGLLAARLDEEGILSLGSTLADYWPDLQLAEGIDPSAITLRDLLTHQFPFEGGPIAAIEANIRDIAPEEYPGLLAEYATAREPGYQYSNLGYNIYAAILEHETGRNWRDWLDDYIFTPLHMGDTSGRVSDYDPDVVAWGHQADMGLAPFWPHQDGWHLVEPKVDGQMQSAGGLMTTGEDFARWMIANLSHEGGDIPASAFETAQTNYVEREGDGHGFSCEGYALGWESCIIIFEDPDASGEIPEPVQLLQHGGGYTGYGSYFTIAPELGVGIAIAHNVDGPAGYIDLELTKMVIEIAMGIDGVAERNAARVERFEGIMNHVAGLLTERREEALADPRWGEGGWSPSIEEQADAIGRYENAEFWVPAFDIVREGDMLRLHADALRRYLVPVSEDIFAVYGAPSDVPEFIALQRDESGNVVSINWDDDIFTRTAN